jgi:NACalpha-BTF3-like transcription factor
MIELLEKLMKEDFADKFQPASDKELDIRTQKIFGMDTKKLNHVISVIIKVYKDFGVGTSPVSGNQDIADMIESYWGEKSDYEIKKDGIYSVDAGELYSWEDEAEQIKTSLSKEDIEELYDTAKHILEKYNNETIT